jgi:hypothetical protein
MGFVSIAGKVVSRLGAKDRGLDGNRGDRLRAIVSEWRCVLNLGAIVRRVVRMNSGR